MQDRTTIGNVQVLAVMDMWPPPRPTSQFFPDVPPQAWEPYRQDQLTPSGEIQIPYCLFVLRSQGQTIMADTGMGPGPHPDRGNVIGHMLEELARLGIAPEDVDLVVHTHLHADHVGWNITYKDGQPSLTFPRARYLVPRADWEHFTRPEVLAQPRTGHIRSQVIPLDQLGAMELMDNDHVITSELSTLHTPGHTPGHMCILISSQGQKGAIVGDVFHMSVQVEHPDWCAGVDVDKRASQHSREKLLEQTERDGSVIAAGHFGLDRHFGRIVRMGERRYWQVL